jgi:hypothetical protein
MRNSPVIAKKMRKGITPLDLFLQAVLPLCGGENRAETRLEVAAN